jgi:tetraacyldisaccharide 4'-kinase
MALARLLTDAFLTVPSTGYYAIQKIREKAYMAGLFSRSKARVPVVSVGNVLMGGSGKTPAVIFLAEMLFAKGLNPAIVSRGYRGSYRDPYLVVSDGVASHPAAGPDVVGDEPYLMAKRLPHIPVIVGRNRIHPVRAATDLFQSNVVILDDGFQHLALKRDADIVLINGLEDRMFPLGRLREPLSALRRADILVLVGRSSSIPSSAKTYVKDLPVFRCEQIASGVMQRFSSPLISPSVYQGQPVMLASAIANAVRFRDLALRLGWKVLDHKVFPDHHVFTDGELKNILEDAGPAPVVVTEKDWVKLPEWFKTSDRVAALRIELAFAQKEEFLQAVLDSIATCPH